MESSKASSNLVFRVARMDVQIDTGAAWLDMPLPAGYRKFKIPFLENTLTVGDAPISLLAGYAKLSLIYRHGASIKPTHHQGIWLSETWELWQDAGGSYLFIPHQDGHDFQVIINKEFSNGEILGNLADKDGKMVFPLESTGILIYVNWLGNYGDFVLHASGIVINGRAYCFVGESGAGKSTLVAALQTDERVTVLGEDQVIVRCIDDQIWLFGTPWHINPALCSPLGAPLERVFFLEKNHAPQLEPLTPVQGVSRMLQTAFIPYYRPDAVEKILANAQLMAGKIPFRLFSYRLGADVLPAILAD